MSDRTGGPRRFLPPGSRETARSVPPGALAAVVVACLGLLVHTGLQAGALTSPGPAVAALVVGLALGPLLRRVAPVPPGRRREPAAGTAPDRWAPGLAWTASRVLQAGIVLLGLTLPVATLLDVGLRTLPVVVAAVGTALLVAHLVGSLLGVPPVLRLLLGAGTGICGASAVAATAGTVRARPADVSYALSVVVLLNLTGVALLPAAAALVGVSAAEAGAWFGAALNDTSAVVAVAGGWGALALAVATVVKLSRVLLLVPLTAVVAWRHHGAGRSRVPGFVWLFLAAVLVSALGVVPAAVRDLAGVAVLALVSVALAAVGLQTRPGALRCTGAAPLLTGAAAWVSVVLVTLALVRLLLA